MLLDSDTSLKCAHDIIHDAMEFFTKWPALIAIADGSSSGEAPAVSNEYVDFEFADGNILRVPSANSIFALTEGNVRASITFRNNGFSEIWATGTASSTAGAFSGMIADGPIRCGTIRLDGIVGLASENNRISIISPMISNFTARHIEMRNATIRQFIGDGPFEINNSELAGLTAPDGEVLLDEHIRADSVVTGDLITLGEKIIPVEKVNGSPVPGTDAIYTEYIPFEALSPNGTPINGYNRPLINNPFYPDWIYTGDRAAPWKPDYAWVPSATIPGVPYWQDADGIYWHKASIDTEASMFGAPGAVWPMRTAVISEGEYVNPTTPPMKAEADGLIVTVHVLSNNPFPICLTDRYERVTDENWSWYPGKTRAITGPRICQFMAKRNLIWENNQIVAVEYQFLPIGDLDG